MLGRRHNTNQRNTFASGTAFFVLAGICTAPALAATASQIDCPDEATQATLEVPARLLAADFVNHSVSEAKIDEVEATPSSSLLALQAAAAIRNAFKSSHTPPMAGTDAKPVSGPENDETTVPDSGMNTKLPGVSEEDFLRYKKQMYRRDI